MDERLIHFFFLSAMKWNKRYQVFYFIGSVKKEIHLFLYKNCASLPLKLFLSFFFIYNEILQDGTYF